MPDTQVPPIVSENAINRASGLKRYAARMILMGILNNLHAAPSIRTSQGICGTRCDH